MSKHTAGPWRFWTQRRPGKEDTCTFQNLDGVEVLRAVTVTITEADARLIAAAPDLLAALQTAEMAMLGYTVRNAVLVKALADVRAAIVKATGAAS